ncbi:serine/threonine-protein kinase [uncultured Thiodictyon sp.]|uniref:serine/threonine protein kinase n=1 Tax=uncultured Thiodictyon sp. TaxID=1846217 RepID=UPI0025ED2E74|nr:serine/threonine-protein kinase [uncultured Thiodictyon sp.]
MSNLIYIEETINSMRDILEGIALYRLSIKDYAVEERYRTARKRLIELKPLIGEVPDFLKDSNDAWGYWDFIKTLSTYDERREFLKNSYDLHYSSACNNYEEVSIEQHFLQRDLVLDEKIGAGGFGTVHKATHAALGSLRAVKVFDPSFYQGEGKPVQRFAREASLLGSLSHRNIVRFYDAGIAGRTPFIVTEFIDGDNLDQIMREKGIFRELEVRKLCLQVLQALQEAHSLGIYHRDIKPSNIMMSGDIYKIVDFGAGVAIEHTLATRLTTSAVGTSGFIAPELQMEPTLLGAGPDLYSVGVTAHYLLTGTLPHPGNMQRSLSDQGVSTDFSDLLIRSLSPPKERYESADDMGTEIGRLRSI